MKKKLLFLVFILSASLSYAQDIRQKLGNPSDYELNMTEFPADTTAAAVILSQNVHIYYELLQDKLQLIHEYEVRVKVLKPMGTEVANIGVIYYDTGDSREKVRIASATAYNIEGKKTVKTELNRKDIFDEMIAKNVRSKKFSIPNVRVGTVIEYKYIIFSDFPHNIRDVEIQCDYPVLISTGNIQIPKIFTYHVNTTGYEQFEIERQSSNVHFPDIIGKEAETIKFSIKNVPALKNEPHVWNPSDFRSKITVEISGYHIPETVHKNLSTSWTAIDDRLSKSDFGKCINMSCPFAEEVQQLAERTEDKTELLRNILKLVTSKIKWNKTYRLFSDNIRRDTKEGSGSSATVNYILNSALRKAGFKTTAVLLSPRHLGRMPITHPSLDHINAFVIAVYMDDQIVVMDATDQDNEVNVLPPSFMVDHAKLYGLGNDGWINLSNPSNNFVSTSMTCEFNEDMELTANVNAMKTNLHSLLAKKHYRSAASEEEYIEEMENDKNIEIEEYAISDLAQKDVIESYTFRQKINKTGDFIYLNATVIPFMSKSIFSQQERKMPIEFPYMENHEIHCRIRIPDGYCVEELPKTEKITLPDSGIVYLYTAKEENGEIICMMNYSVNRMLYSVEEYPMIFEIYGNIVSRSNANIVLKKV